MFFTLNKKELCCSICYKKSPTIKHYYEHIKEFIKSKKWCYIYMQMYKTEYKRKQYFQPLYVKCKFKNIKIIGDKKKLDNTNIDILLVVQLQYLTKNTKIKKMESLKPKVITKLLTLKPHMLLFTKSRRCNYCMKKPITKKRFKMCSRCQGVSYCSISCQKKDWDEKHKWMCDKITLDKIIEIIKYQNK